MAKIVLPGWGQLRREVNEVLAIVGGHYHPVQTVARLAAPDLASSAAARRSPSSSAAGATHVSATAARSPQRPRAQGGQDDARSDGARGVGASAPRLRLGSSYLDAIYLKLRPDHEPAGGVVVAWGLKLESQNVLPESQNVLPGATRLERELRVVACLRARPEVARDAGAGTGHVLRQPPGEVIAA